MRSSFNSFTPSSYSPSVYSPSPLVRNPSGNIPTRFELPSSPSGISYRDPSFCHDYPGRESESRNSESSSSRFYFRRLSSEDRKPVENVVNSRLTRDDETNSLLERYCTRKISATERFSQSYLKQRRQQQSESDGVFGVVRRKSDTTGFESILSGDGFNLSRTPDRKEVLKQPNNDIQDIMHVEYLNRLLAAHNRVDDLLRSRGLSVEDESKYLRAWEEIPTIREERYQRARKLSNSSDSGLSTDNDSDRSHSEGITNEESVCEVFVRPELNNTCSKVFPTPLYSALSSHSCKAFGSTTLSATFTFKKKPLCKLNHHVILMRVPLIELVDLVCKSPLYVSTAAYYVLQKTEESLIKKKALLCARKGENLKAAILVRQQAFQILRKHAESKIHFGNPPTRQWSKNVGRKPVFMAAQQNMLLARLKYTPMQLVPSLTVEISVQHCSFYQVSQRGIENPPENNVRLNLRLTERAPNNLTTAITLPTTLRTILVRLDAPFIKELQSRDKTFQVVTRAAIGKLDRSTAVDPPKNIRQHRKVKPLRIPEFFLQSDQAITEEIKNVRNHLKRVDRRTSSEIVVVPKKPIPLKQLNVIKKKRNPENFSAVSHANKNCVYDLDFPPPTSPPPLIQDDKLLSSVLDASEPCLRTKEVVCTLDVLNFPASLDGAVTPSGAACRKPNLAEFSLIDHLLIERFIRSKHIPRPKALRQCASLYELEFHDLVQLKPLIRPSTPPRVEFIRSRSPLRRPKQVHHHSSPPILRSSCSSIRPLLKRERVVNYPPLKKVDRSLRKPKVKIGTAKRWIPSWRKNSEEEVVQDAEDEEEEEVEESINIEKSDSSKFKAHFDDDDSMTEAEKAMAASKRRQVVEQQNKLQEYDERRRIEREKEEEELKKLKEKQERRRLEREQEEREQAERRKIEEDRRRKEEEDRKAKQEQEKRKKDEEKMRRQQMTGAAFTSAAGHGGRNFVIPKRSENRNDKFGNIVQAKQEMGMTKEQQEEAKRAFLASVARGVPISADLQPSDLKAKIKELHQRICKLEAEKYDLEKRHERQEYDLKELNERQRQVARSNALKKGVDPADAASSKYPPKVQIVSKYDRQIDRRNFNERRRVYDTKNAYPCFPGVPPPPALFEKTILKIDTERDDDKIRTVHRRHMQEPICGNNSVDKLMLHIAPHEVEKQ